MPSFKKVFAGIVQSLIEGAELLITGNGSIRGDNTGDQTDATLPFSDITTNNSSTLKHGFLRKLTGNTAYFLNAKGEWTIPSGTGVSSVTASAPLYSSGGLTPNISFTPTHDIYTAFAGGGQGGAAPLTKMFNGVDTVVSPSDSVIMLPAVPGVWQWVRNDSLAGNDMNLYPQPGQNFRGFPVDFPLPISPGQSVMFFCYIAGEFR